MSKYTHLWNDLPKEERKRLMPYEIESQLLHVRQCKQRAERHHRAHMLDINGLISNLESDLAKYD